MRASLAYGLGRQRFVGRDSGTFSGHRYPSPGRPDLAWVAFPRDGDVDLVGAQPKTVSLAAAEALVSNPVVHSLLPHVVPVRRLADEDLVGEDPDRPAPADQARPNLRRIFVRLDDLEARAGFDQPAIWLGMACRSAGGEGSATVGAHRIGPALCIHEPPGVLRRTGSACESVT